MVVIPTIVGLLNSEVEQALEAAGLVAGLVEPRFSLEPGGIVLSQGHPAGGLLEFGTPMAFSVARDRILWAGPLLGVVAFVVVGLVVRRLRAGSTPQPSTGPATDLAPAPAVPIRTERDPDRQTTPPDAQPETTLTVRWKPTVDGGTQTLEVDGDLHNFGRLIANDRRQP